VADCSIGITMVFKRRSVVKKALSLGIALWIVTCAGLVVAAQPDASGDRSAAAARGLLSRILPDQSDNFVFESIPDENDFDVFEIVGGDGKVTIRGNNGVAMASGLNWYLKYYCHCHLSFCGDQLNLPDPLPAVPEKVRKVTPHRWRYFFNYCAFSYTMPWWNWAQWERMIDWMALHGVNMPLSVTGQEAIWQKVYRDLGLSDAQIKQFFVGPAYLPFGWMGCLDGWCGPTPDSWIQSHLELQKQIVARERELGMKPVLQGFTGHVPAALKEKFPDLPLRRLRSWSGFPGTYFVEPTDPMFKKIGKALVDEQTREFGTDHLYAADTFIEMTPPSSDPAFLAAMGRAVHGSMLASDPRAVWVMQGWVFLSKKDFWKPPQAKALFGAVPDDRMILLDLFCEREPVWDKTDAFYGKPWIFCVLHNFGGKVGLYGGDDKIVENLGAAMTSPRRGKLSGIGMTMEGFGYNPVLYDLVTDMTWRDKVPDLETWTAAFAQRRYGVNNPSGQRAWRILGRTIYCQPAYTGTVICARPGLPARRNWENRAARFDRAAVAAAWRALLEGYEALSPLDTYQYDVVHLARENMAALADRLADDAYKAYEAKDAKAFDAASRRFLELIRDMDALLGTRPEFLFGKWTADAKRCATNEEERRLYEWNARTIITLWGPPEGRLNEYAHRQWSGLLAGFYLRRWEMFFERLAQSLANKQPFDAAQFDKDIRVWEEKWTHQTETYPATPQGDPVAASHRMWDKYGAQCAQPVARETK
jgi:alpha-N-acetylglucosaminidase